MKVVMVAVRDQAVDAFGNPWFAQTLPMAMRHFGDAVNTVDDTNQWRKHPDDFALYHLGHFDTSTAQFDPIFPPTQLCLARDVLQK